MIFFRLRRTSVKSAPIRQPFPIQFVNPFIYLVETGLAICLMLGIAVRLGALLGIAMALNLWIGLYHLQAEWPWCYIFIAFLHMFFVADRAGRALGLDAILARCYGARSALIRLL